MTTLIFIRHAIPQIDPTCSADLWGLSEQGVSDAVSARFTVNADACVLSSDERKAQDTTALMTSRSSNEVTIEPDFGEVRRDEPVDSLFRERRRAWVSGVADSRHAGWETFEDAGRRVDEALKRHWSETMVVGTHGMVLTSWLVFAGVIQAGNRAAEFWESLKFPEVLTLHSSSKNSFSLER